MSYQTIRTAFGAALLAAACSAETTVSPPELAPNLYLTNTGAQVRINDATRNEVDGGLTIGFEVRMTGYASQPVLLQYSVRPADAPAGFAATEGAGSCTAGADYVDAGAGLVSLSNSDPVKTVSFTICGDTRDEPDEQMVVTLIDYSASGVQMVDAQAIGTILDNDAPPAFSIRDVRVFETDSGRVNHSAAIIDMVGSSQQEIQLFWRTIPNSGFFIAPGTATDGGCDGRNSNTAGDFVTVVNGVITIPAGTRSPRIELAWCGDFRVAPDERYSVQLTSATGNATITDSIGVVTILDDDASRAQLSIAADPDSISEGRAFDYDNPVMARFVVSATNLPASGAQVTVQWETANGTAFGGTSCGSVTTGPTGYAIPVDYVRSSGTVAISLSSPTTTIEIPVCGDAQVVEPVENFSVRIFGPSVNAFIVRSVGTVVVRAQQ